jgi:hypothetical protein
MKVRYALLLVAPLALGACSESTGPNAIVGLTRDEAVMIAAAVSGSWEGTAQQRRVSNPDGVSLVPVTVTQQAEISAPCPNGGTATLAWTATVTGDDETQSLMIDIDGHHTPSHCAYTHGNVVITIHADAPLNFSSYLNVVNGAATEPYRASVDGAFSWTTSDGRSGTCSVDYEETLNFALQQHRLQGSVCGFTVNQTLSWQAGA